MYASALCARVLEACAPTARACARACVPSDIIRRNHSLSPPIMRHYHAQAKTVSQPVGSEPYHTRCICSRCCREAGSSSHSCTWARSVRGRHRTWCVECGEGCLEVHAAHCSSRWCQIAAGARPCQRPRRIRSPYRSPVPPAPRTSLAWVDIR